MFRKLVGNLSWQTHSPDGVFISGKLVSSLHSGIAKVTQNPPIGWAQRAGSDKVEKMIWMEVRQSSLKKRGNLRVPPAQKGLHSSNPQRKGAAGKEWGRSGLATFSPWRHLCALGQEARSLMCHLLKTMTLPLSASPLWPHAPFVTSFLQRQPCCRSGPRHVSVGRMHSVHNGSELLKRVRQHSRV